MTTKFKLNTDLIDTFINSLTAAKEEAANCEAALAEAERIADLSPDDETGKSPEELYEREENIRKSVFLRKAESTQAAKKVAKIEAEFLELANGDVTNITTALGAKLQEVKASLRAQLSDLIAEADNPAQVALFNFVDHCDDVQSRDRALRIITMSHDGSGLIPMRNLTDLARGLGLALKLI